MSSRALPRALCLAGLFASACGARSALDLPLSFYEASSGGSSGADGGGARDASGGTGGSGTGSGGSGGSGSGSGSASGASGTSSFVNTGIGTGCAGGTSEGPPSCAGGSAGTTGCGACDESCCTSFDVPAVTYFRTYANDGTGATMEADPATVSSFRLDRYLVTVGRFRQFVTAWDNGNGYTPPIGSGLHTHLNGGQGLAAAGAPGTYEEGWTAVDQSFVDPTHAHLTQCAPANTWTRDPGANESLPMNCVNWYEAYAFCIWDGGFLPSEAEWELAAAAGPEQREYPWGSADPGMASAFAIYGDGASSCYFPSPETCVGTANIAPVGSAAMGAGLYGQLDLAGDVGEWVLDWFVNPYVNPCVDCAEVAEQSLHTLRGGSYDEAVGDIVPPFREGRYPPGRTGDVGFRCARVP